MTDVKKRVRGEEEKLLLWILDYSIRE